MAHTHTQQQPLMVFTEVLSKKEEDFLVVQLNFLFRSKRNCTIPAADSIVGLVVAKKAYRTARQGPKRTHTDRK